ncbi:uncharacterized protein LOC113301906 [Papaver somniferum]|uniref:uncharacterized protein LOC113301906 n=1 Tax=Papaver somniferum TaxID=3469 RepID=UPI000E6F6202|nr:uncharacterized protein LOC113301906 [Papaver somniferum]
MESMATEDVTLEFSSVPVKVRNEADKTSMVQNSKLDESMKRQIIFQTKEEIREMHRTCYRIPLAIEEKLDEIDLLRCQWRDLADEDERYKEFIDGKKNKIVRQALRQHRDGFEFGTFQKKSDDLCSSEKELNSRMCNLYYRTRCGRNKCAEEKKLCAEIKQLEDTREKVIYKDKIYEECCNFQTEVTWPKFERPAKTFRNKINLEDMDLNKLKRARQVYGARLKYLREKVKSLNNEIRVLQATLITTTKKSKAAEKRLHQLQKEQNTDRTNWKDCIKKRYKGDWIPNADAYLLHEIGHVSS